MLVMTAMVQIVNNPIMPEISYPMNHLHRQSNLVNNWEASLALGPSSQGRWRFIGNHRLCRSRRIKRESFFKEIKELRQVYNLQFMQITERKVLLNCKCPIATTKGSGTQACIKYVDYSERNNCYSYDWSLWNVWSTSQVVRCLQQVFTCPIVQAQSVYQG